MRFLPLLALLACPHPDKDADTGDDDGRHHPDGFYAPEAHGPAAKQQDEACTSCHGADLTGGTAAEPSCDACHPSDWRTDCTFCHGGTDNTTGAPPRDISGETSASATTFPEHTAHVTTNLHAAFDCEQCHSRPTDVLSVGHIFVGDTTKGVAETDFTLGLSPAGSYDGLGGCSNLYCHGNGQGNNGTATSGDDVSACDDCHGSRTNRRGDLSGRHSDHLEEGLGCAECHSATVSGDSTVSDPAKHVNGVADVVLPYGMARDERGFCTGTCHEEYHGGRLWPED
jgi:predicted CxxxxCH...CXXCH cytochrome family protein